MYHVTIAAGHTGLFRFFSIEIPLLFRGEVSVRVRPATDRRRKHVGIREQSALFSLSVEWREEMDGFTKELRISQQTVEPELIGLRESAVIQQEFWILPPRWFL